MDNCVATSPFKIVNWCLDCRPIGLVTSVYIILAKILAERLREILPKTMAKGSLHCWKMSSGWLLLPMKLLRTTKTITERGLFLRLALKKFTILWTGTSWMELWRRRALVVDEGRVSETALGLLGIQSSLLRSPKVGFRPLEALHKAIISPFLFLLVVVILSRIVPRGGGRVLSRVFRLQKGSLVGVNLSL